MNPQETAWGFSDGVHRESAVGKVNSTVGGRWSVGGRKKAEEGTQKPHGEPHGVPHDHAGCTP